MGGGNEVGSEAPYALLTSNPPLVQQEFPLSPGKSAFLDFNTDQADVPFDETGRAQIRAVVDSTVPMLRATFQIFDSIGRTTIFGVLDKLDKQ